MELGLAQRYYWQVTGIASLGNCFARTATQATGVIHHPVEMRDSPIIATNTSTGVAYASVEIGNGDYGSLLLAKSGGSNSNTKATAINATNGAATMPVGQGGRMLLTNSSAFIGFSAEL